MPPNKNNFQNLKASLKNMPTSPGCYIFRDYEDKIFYIGKAINIKNRLKNYFSGQDTRYFVAWLKDILASIETIVVNSNKEALLLEQTLIQKHKPKFNILLKDDKNFLMLKLKSPKIEDKNKKLENKYPKLEIVRRVLKDKAKYFGPYPSAGQIRQTVELINKYFQLRTCSDRILNNRARPCIQHQMGRCPAPCVYDVDLITYESEINLVKNFLKGQRSELINKLKQKMTLASESENFEQAAHLRDSLDAIKESLESQSIRQADESLSCDVFGLEREGPAVCIVALEVRSGKINSIKDYLFENQPFPEADILGQFLEQYYKNQNLNHKIKNIYVSHQVSNLFENNNITKPERGQKKNLLNIALKNAKIKLDNLNLDQQKAQKSLENLKSFLDLNFLPIRIECFDNSLFQGTDSVASQVVFTNGIADKSEYKKYHIKTVEGTDDFAMMREVLGRRLKNYDNKNLLIIVDGGKGQLSAALDAAKKLDLEISPSGPLYIVGIAKARAENKFRTELQERIFSPNNHLPKVLDPHSLEKSLIERLRDEAHRFAITFHRSKRSKRIFKSELDQIAGVGPKTKKLLIKHFGSLKKIKSSSLADLEKVVSSRLAHKIFESLN